MTNGDIQGELDWDPKRVIAIYNSPDGKGFVGETVGCGCCSEAIPVNLKDLENYIEYLEGTRTQVLGLIQEERVRLNEQSTFGAMQ